MKSLLIAVLVSAILVTVPMHSLAFDGTKWKLLNADAEIAYLLGFYDGLILQKEYGSEYTKYITWKMSYIDMAIEVDKFYADYKNLNIKVGEALIIFNAGIQGMSEEEIDELKRILRQLRGNQ